MASAIPSRELLALFRCSAGLTARRRLPYIRPQCIRSVATHTHTHHASAISILPTAVDTSSPDFRENKQQMNELMARMTELHAKIAQGGAAEGARQAYCEREDAAEGVCWSFLISHSGEYLEL